MRIVRATLRAASRRTSGFGLARPPFLNTGFPCRPQVTIITGSSAASSFSFSARSVFDAGLAGSRSSSRCFGSQVTRSSS